MKLLLTNFLIILFLQSWTKADDIRDFEIEGMSAGDSLLDYMSRKKIKEEFEATKDHYKYLKKPNKFREAYILRDNNFETYNSVSFYVKPNDKNYIISGIRGALFCNSKSECINQHTKIINDLKNSFSGFKNSRSEKFKHPDDVSGKSTVELLFLNLNKGYITVRYTDWSDKMDFTDNVDVEIGTTEVEKWLRSNYGNN